MKKYTEFSLNTIPMLGGKVFLPQGRRYGTYIVRLIQGSSTFQFCARQIFYIQCYTTDIYRCCAHKGGIYKWGLILFFTPCKLFILSLKCDAGKNIYNFCDWQTRVCTEEYIYNQEMVTNSGNTTN